MTTAEAVAAMLKVWNTIESEAKRQFPKASDDEIYEITAAAMNHQIAR